MTERPILFSAPMVKAVLSGEKTQTRRVVKLGGAVQSVDLTGAVAERRERYNFVRLANGHEYSLRPPYGVPGDRLWVRETFRHFGNSSQGRNPVQAQVRYRADDATMLLGAWESFEAAPHRAWWNTGRSPWTPGIHMPRWASRIALELTSVRVERLAEISWDDACAEGWPGSEDGAVRWFKRLWDSINAKRGFGWDTNPWVWVLGFPRMAPS